ncbi:hypothetical protein RRG08_004950 [Elysia crispata]|uniref:Amine oxidase n=1 Tax=Elysia crispata TaxID=231223 RepID=A0AAE0ZHV6_9GAST|nr:hypothetical protein RRG08_004950 [Elysia crispata]
MFVFDKRELRKLSLDFSFRDLSQVTMKFSIILFLILCIVHCFDGNESFEDKKNKFVGDEEKDFNKKFALPKDVVVIGAGMAGLAAARRLTTDKTNFTVNIYEARRERFGGRVWTDKLANPRAKGPEVDLGAFSLTAAGKNNPLFELAADLGLKSVSLGELQLLIPWEKRVVIGTDLDTVFSETSKILELAMNESKASKIEMSVREAVDAVISNGKVQLSDSASSYLIQSSRPYLLDYSGKYPQSFQLGFAHKKVLLDGMGELTDRLLSGDLDEPPLHLGLNKAARQIKIDKKRNKVVVRFTDGSQVIADAVVVAVPLSIISSGDLQFEPFLPKAYYEAAKEMGITWENRVIVEFDHAFWPQEIGMFVRAVQAEEEMGHLQVWFNINQIVGVPALSGYLGGKAAEAFEKLSDEEAEKAVLSVLLEMFGESLLSQGGKVVRLQRSAWISDSWSKGAATYPKVGSSPSMWDIFAEPICPGVYFAGEHTSFVDHGTVHGAYVSGLRAASQIMGDLCEQKRLEQEERERKQREAEMAKKEKETSGTGTIERSVCRQRKEKISINIIGSPIPAAFHLLTKKQTPTQAKSHIDT